jgi:hypothetical protein
MGNQLPSSPSPPTILKPKPVGPRRSKTRRSLEKRKNQLNSKLNSYLIEIYNGISPCSSFWIGERCPFVFCIVVSDIPGYSLGWPTNKVIVWPSSHARRIDSTACLCSTNWRS